MAAIERGMGDYYTSLSSSEAREHTNWADFAMHEFPKEAP
jgi:hypothetical protein